ncbi:MAG: patatin-like phospholipase family protein [Candidatus Nanopelagicales bacterium]
MSNNEQSDATTRGIAFGGGGLWFLTWTVAYCEAAVEAGIPLDQADLTVGTSAGSLGAPILLSGAAKGALTKAEAVAQHPELMSKVLAAPAPASSQERAAEILGSLTDTNSDSILKAGRAAMAAHNPSPEAYVKTLELVLGGIDWPGDKHHVTAVDCYTGERLVIDRESSIPLATACAASSSLPGLNGPIWINDQLCMDGGVSGSSTHSDVVSSADKVLILSLMRPGSHPHGSFGLSQRTNPKYLNEELAAIEAKGNKGLLISADPPEGINFMDPHGMNQAIDLAHKTFADTEQQLRDFWGS